MRSRALGDTRARRRAPLGLAVWLAVSSCSGTGLERSAERSEWVQAEAGPFRLVSDLGRERALELAARLATFERFARVVTDAKTFRPRVPTVVLALSSRAYAAFDPPRNTLGVFIATSRANTVLLDGENPDQVPPESILYHEYSHFVLQNSSSFSYPAWYDEGMAEMLRSTRAEAGDLLLGEPLADRVRTLAERGFMPSEQLFRVGSPLQMRSARDAELFYAQSWLTVLYLMYADRRATAGSLPMRREQALRYLGLFDEGVPVAQAFEQAFAMSFADLDRELQSFFRDGSVAIRRVPQAALGSGPEPALRVLRPAEAAEALGEAALSSGKGYAQAERLFRRSLALEPGRTRAAFGLARSRLLRNRARGLAALFERARALAPGDLTGQLDYAEYLLWCRARAPAGDGPGSRAWLARRAAALLERVALSNPELPEALYLLGLAYSARGEPAQTVSAVFARAYALLSSDDRIAYGLATSLAQEGRVEEARRVAARALASTHDSSAAAALAALVASWSAGP